MPARAMAAAQAVTATASGRPWRRTRPVHPLNGAVGMANVIAAMSTAQDIDSTGAAAMNRSPSKTVRSPPVRATDPVGMIAPRAADDTAKAPAWTATRAGMRGTERRSATA
ncbi:hypothetical protein [Streptomyces mirabilis]|uniref:hypothetical protein n=1 Tax=Streptomyces mirabilis TaxID=68239 RepID=UPI0036D7A61D